MTIIMSMLKCKNHCDIINGLVNFDKDIERVCGKLAVFMANNDRKYFKKLFIQYLVVLIIYYITMLFHFYYIEIVSATEEIYYLLTSIIVVTISLSTLHIRDISHMILHRFYKIMHIF